MSLSRLKQRISTLEKRIAPSEDPLISALDALDDSELNLLREIRSLVDCGYTIDQIEGHFGERWPDARVALEKFGKAVEATNAGNRGEGE